MILLTFLTTGGGRGGRYRQLKLVCSPNTAGKYRPSIVLRLSFLLSAITTCSIGYTYCFSYKIGANLDTSIDC